MQPLFTPSVEAVPLGSQESKILESGEEARKNLPLELDGYLIPPEGGFFALEPLFLAMFIHFILDSRKRHLFSLSPSREGMADRKRRLSCQTHLHHLGDRSNVVPPFSPSLLHTARSII